MARKATAKRKDSKPKTDGSWIERATRDFYQALLEARRTGTIDLRTDDDGRLLAAVREAVEASPPPIGLRLNSIIIPDRKTKEGILVGSTAALWTEIVGRLHNNWDEAYSIPPEKWEEVIAGAFKKAGYDEVTITPRSGDFGRDVIAVKNGIGCVKIIGSVKAYAPKRRVGQDDVRALLGVLTGEQNASKGIITTTSNFAPGITSDPFIKAFLPTRLELVNGEQLRKWLTELANK